jgi:prophage tail gpP-like protein
LSIINSRAGETWADISRRAYGTQTGAAQIQAANPGLFEPLPAGAVISIPPDPAKPPAEIATRRQDLSASEPKITIDGEKVGRWTALEIRMPADGIRTASISAPFNPRNKETAPFWLPFRYQRVRISARGKTLITGTAQNPAYSAGLTDRRVTMSAYSLPGIMQETTPPISAYPLDFKGRRLDFIARKIAGIYGLKIIFKIDPGAAFDNVSLDPGTTPLNWLIDLAQRRGILLTDDPDGNLVATRETETSPRADLKYGEPPVENMSIELDAGAAFSSVTAWRPATSRQKGAKYTVTNPHLQGVRRPFVFRADSTDGGSVKVAAESKAARMFPEMVTWRATVAAWDDGRGNIWAPGDSVNIYGPEVLVYNKTRMLIRSVTLQREPDREWAELELVLPGCFSLTMPRRLPWA